MRWRLCGLRKMLRQYCTIESRTGRSDGKVPSGMGISRALVGCRSIRTIIRDNDCNPGLQDRLSDKHVSLTTSSAIRTDERKVEAACCTLRLRATMASTSLRLQ